MRYPVSGALISLMWAHEAALCWCISKMDIESAFNKHGGDATQLIQH